MILTFEKMPRSHNSMMLKFVKDASVTSQYDATKMLHHSMMMPNIMMTKMQDASMMLHSQYDVNIRVTSQMHSTKSHHSMMINMPQSTKYASVTSQYDNNIRREASSHQYDVNIRQRCICRITV